MSLSARARSIEVVSIVQALLRFRSCQRENPDGPTYSVNEELVKKYDQYSIADRIAEVRAKNICSERELSFLIPWFVLSWGARPENASVSRV